MLLETKLSLAGTPPTLAGGTAIAFSSLLPHESFFQQNAELLHTGGGIVAGVGALLLVAGYALRTHNDTLLADTNPSLVIPFTQRQRAHEVARLQKNQGKRRYKKFW